MCLMCSVGDQLYILELSGNLGRKRRKGGSSHCNRLSVGGGPPTVWRVIFDQLGAY